ncbi:solute carrier family 13 member 5-like [Lytechinus variegatus]|uniref:solute carrier family 13 member 5-like n=1 Tax=Lytechinus variegatus TaxID=7654 RepID=UPI001BB0EA84|nr:solute carrier family 13 member 5-like [Lytechinus variegatus]
MSEDIDDDERKPLLSSNQNNDDEEVCGKNSLSVSQRRLLDSRTRQRETTGMQAGDSGELKRRGSLVSKRSDSCSSAMDAVPNHSLQPAKVNIFTIFWAYWKTILLIATPLLCLPLIIVIGDGPSKGAFVIIIMAVYWIFEVLPLAVTSLLPVILYPLLGVQDSDDVCRNYLKDTNFLFVGGLIMAVAVEHWMVHRRFALGVLLLMGSKLRWLMLGFMLVTAFLSMWISNTATTAMMVPIAQSVVMQLLDQRKDIKRKREAEAAAMNPDDLSNEKGMQVGETAFNGHINSAMDMSEEKYNEKELIEGDVQSTDVDKEAETKDNESNDEIDYDAMPDADRKLCKGLLLCVAYAANIGGTATLTGTGPNVVLGGVVDELYGDEAGVTFASWLLFSIPGTVINLVFCWLWLQVIFIGFRPNAGSTEENTKEEEKAARQVIKQEYKKLGPWTWGQIAVLCHFIVLAMLWLFRNPTFIPGFAGWSGLFPVPGYISDATAAIIIAILLFIFPAYPPWFLRIFKIFRQEDDEKPKSRSALLDWKTTQRMLPWNVILLLGGGFALADGTEASGLSQWLADQFKVLDFLPSWVFVIIITVIICFFTEFTSNVATATIFLPILAALAESICINPLYIMLPATISCSYAFMLPVATPPNAIAFSYGSLAVPDMMRAGSLMNVIGIIVVNLLINSMGILVFDVFNYPTWADNTAGCLANTTTPTA